MLRVLRFRDWAHFLLLPLAGAGPVEEVGTVASVGRGVVLAALVLAFGYLVNSLSDRTMDADARKNPLIESALGGRSLALALTILAGLAIAIALVSPLQVQWATLLALGSGTVYSVGLRLKRVPGVGTLMNATNFAPLLWMGVRAEGPPAGLAFLTVVFVGLLLQNQLIHELADLEEDKRGGVRSTALVVGPPASSVLAAGFGMVVVYVLCSSTATAWMGGILALPLVVMFPWALIRHGRDGRTMTRVRLLHRAFALAAGAAVFLGHRLADAAGPA